ncbi:hypothetical protein [Rhizobium sp. RU36D]|uniref:hypothetical protein n=1 Tax=Rhizobium sp. RU36D TaxID=1907415 RepID=UPI0009D8DB7F|nr:hypothetical protein [Rhizobium sp. RU36D]SMC65164.1 hypothetical protein SAMN05880593_10485 [Rhizobium sp. RU36D]
MLSQTNGVPNAAVISAATQEIKPTNRMHWLYDEGLREDIAEDDDFEGSRNWAVILVLLALSLSPIAAMLMLLL